MLAKYYRFRVFNGSGATLTYNSSARLDVRFQAQKFTSGALVYATAFTEDFATPFTTGDTIADGADINGSAEPIESAVIDNSSDLNLEGEGYFEVTVDSASSTGSVHLFLETSDDNTNWPSDAADFDIELDLRHVAALQFSGTTTETRATNFKIS